MFEKQTLQLRLGWREEMKEIRAKGMGWRQVCTELCLGEKPTSIPKGSGNYQGLDKLPEDQVDDNVSGEKGAVVARSVGPT